MKRQALAFLALLSAGSAAQADPVLECSIHTSSQVETARCVSQTEEDAEAALDIVLGFARNSARSLDETTGRDVALPALDASQSAWLAWRDAHCAYAGSLFGGGSGTGIAITTCRINLTRDRTDDLYRLLQ